MKPAPPVIKTCIFATFMSFRQLLPNDEQAGREAKI
jgi:hypothetical protein